MDKVLNDIIESEANKKAAQKEVDIIYPSLVGLAESHTAMEINMPTGLGKWVLVKREYNREAHFSTEGKGGPRAKQETDHCLKCGKYIGGVRVDAASPVMCNDCFEGGNYGK